MLKKLKRKAAKALRDGRNKYLEHELRNCGLNEAINFETSTIFVAVPKTGTTSIRDQTREQRRFLLKRPHLNIREIRKGIDFYFLSQALDRNRSFPTDPALVPSTTEALDKAAAFYENAFKFASVRNPWARTASLFFRSEGMKCSKNMDFSQFCDELSYASDTCTKPTRHANQVEWFTDEHDNIAVDFIMKLEDWTDAIERIREMTNGRVQLLDITARKNPASKAKSYHDIYDDKSRKTVARLFEKDIDILKYTY